MIKLRGKLRIFIIMAILFTTILVLYKAVGEGEFASGYQRLDANSFSNRNQPVASARKQGISREIYSSISGSYRDSSRKHLILNNDIDPDAVTGHQDSLSDHYHKSKPSKQGKKWRSEKNGVIKNTNYQKAFDNMPVDLMVNDRPAAVPHVTEETRRRTNTAESTLESSSAPQLFPQKIVHLDLKGAPPKISYYKKVFPVLKKLGVTGLLVEYEDMFPYWGSLRNFSAHNSYSKADIATMQQLAATYDFEYIPLVQTFGHMEFALKIPDFDHLREVPASPQAICPSKPGSLALVKKMVDQVMALHPDIRYLHIGCDEVFHLAECSVCHTRMAEHNWGKDDLFLNHSLTMAQYVTDRHKVKPVMWDDMFRLMPEHIILNSNISRYVEIMAWRYNKDILAEFPPNVWEKYLRIFPSIWIASAFKGSTGPNQYLTKALHHLENHMAWVQTAKSYSSRIQFKGIVITGWQRYDHFAVLCELFPVALPSLAISLLYLEGHNMANGLLPLATNTLDCNHVLTLDLYYTPYMDIVSCRYPGAKVFEGAQRLYMIHQEIENAMQTNYVKGWVEEYSMRWLFSNPDYVMRALESIDAHLYNLTNLQSALASALAEVYDKYTVNEWIETFITPTLEKLNRLSSSMGKMLEKRNWSRRPFDFNRTQRISSHDVNSL